MLKVSLWRGVIRFEKHGKLSPQFIGPLKKQASSSFCKKTHDKARQAPGRRFLKEGKLDKDLLKSKDPQRLDNTKDDRLLMSDQLNMMYTDRRAYAHTARLMESEARLSRLRVVDYPRQTLLVEALTLLKILQTQMAALQRWRGPARGPTHPKKMEPKRTTRSTPATITTTTTTPVTNAQLKEQIDQGVANALAARDADRSRNKEDNHDSGTGLRRQAPLTRECTYQDFMKCKPLYFKESDKIKRYIGGFPDMIHRSVMASKPQTMQDETEDKSEKKRLKDVSIVQDFPEVFPDDLSAQTSIKAHSVFKKDLPRIRGTRGSASKSTTIKSAGKWNFPTFTKTSLATSIGGEIDRSASLRVIKVGVSSRNEILFHTDNGMRFMLAPRLVKAKKSSIPKKSHGMRNLPRSLSFSVEEPGVDEPELGNPGLDKLVLDKLEAGFDDD
nr:hypothetical protein [Tanacetum cinerariifolium]